MPTLIVVGDSNPCYVPSFTIPLVIRDYLYGMPTAMMEGLQSHDSMFADNVATIAPPFNPYLASGSAISNPDRMTQPQV